MLEVVATAAVAFVATNLDDIVILALLFARRNATFHTRHIVGGQYAGFAVLVLVSFAIGRGLAALPAAAIGALGIGLIAFGVLGVFRAGHGEDDELPALGTFGVASMTVANGADDIAIYAPFFATLSVVDAAVTTLVFAVLVAVMCAAARLIGSRRAVVDAVDRVGDYAIPLVMIALGAFIAWDSFG